MTTTTLIPFARLVKEMRRAQEEFFRTAANERPPDLIGRAIELERRVDAEIAAVLGPPGLFDRDEDEEP